ncbi:MAG: sulfotransferase family protein [Hyphomicrobiales bacterium]
MLQIFQKKFSIPKRRMEYIVHISERFNCIYVQTPKVACTTIKKTMQLMERDAASGVEIENPHDRASSPLKLLSTTSRSYDNLFIDDSMYRFTFVRNPYTRIASTFLDKFAPGRPQRGEFMPKIGLSANDELSFEDFLHIIRNKRRDRLNKHWMPLTLLTQFDRFNYSFIGRFENFEEDFSKVVHDVYGQRYDESAHRMSPHSTGADARFRELIGRQEQELIEEIYQSDFEIFGYSKSLDAISA